MKKLFLLLIIAVFVADVPAQAFLFWGKSHKEKKMEKAKKRKLEEMRAEQGYRTLPYDFNTGHTEFATLSKKEQRMRSRHHMYPLRKKYLKEIEENAETADLTNNDNKGKDAKQPATDTKETPAPDKKDN
jgi:hypothetical protein